MVYNKRRDKVLLLVETHDNRFLYVQDHKTSEWAYIMGGCKAHSIPLHNAIREFHEETNHALELPAHRFNYVNTFRTSFRPPELLHQDHKEDIRVTSHFHVFHVKLDDHETHQIIHGFHSNAHNSSQYPSLENTETKNVMFTTRCNPIWSTEPIWDFMDLVVYRNIRCT